MEWVDNLRVVNTLLSVVVAAFGLYRVRRTNNRDAADLVAWYDVIVVGVAYASYNSIGRPVNYGQFIICVGLIGTLATLIRKEYRQRKGKGDVNGGE